MQPKKDTGIPTRKSERISQKNSRDRTLGESSNQAIEPDDHVLDIPSSTEPYEPAEDPSDPESEEPVTTLSSTESNSPVATPSDPEQDLPVASIEESDYDSAKEQLKAEDIATFTNLSTARKKNKHLLPTKSADMASPTPTPAELQATIDRLLAQINSQNDNLRDREVTPAHSAFGGEKFTPVGFAALPAFTAYGTTQKSANPNYDRKARKAGVEAGIFNGDKEEFDHWIITVADKFEEDDITFKTERSRMAVLHASTKGPARDLLASRYQSIEYPYTGVAEMVAGLQAVYHDRNQGSRAREELRTLMYNPRDKTMDIHQFIGKINSLADKANIVKSERKTTLYEHIPANLNVELFDASENPNISYETFVIKVANSALAKQRAYEQSKSMREDKAYKKERSPSDTKRTRRCSGDYKKEVKVTTTPVQETGRPSEKEMEILKAADLCFICKKSGHRARQCPERKVMAKLLTSFGTEEIEQKSGKEKKPSASSSSETSDSEN